MDSLKRERTQLRRLFTNTLKDVETVMKTEPVSQFELMPVFNILTDKANRLFENDEKVRSMWLESEMFDEDEFSRDLDSTENYRNQWIAVKTKVDLILSTDVVNDISSVPNETKRNFRLPKLELKKFDGEIKNWLGFWGQFKKIHEDKSIDSDDKFQFLLQATEVGSSARVLVESFPPSGANYSKAVEQLKSRFARDELLIEIYVRELLNLVLTQAKNEENFTLRSLYDKLETQLRALETLGVTSDKYEAMLYPLVESALPEGLIKEWERTRSRVKNEDKKNILSDLLEFLRSEVESDEKLQIARSGFAKEQDFNPSKLKNRIPTAACIVSNEKKGNERNCIFCSKSSHHSSECFKAADMSLEEKRETLKKKKACFVCLKPGHQFKICKTFVKCIMCKKKHHSVMCPNIGETKQDKKQPESDTKILLSPKNSSTLLLTVLVKIISNGKSGIVRGLFDTGAQRSFIRKDIVNKMNLKPVDHEMLSHGLFGGGETKQESHSVYNITLQSLCSRFKCNISVLDEKKICGDIPRVQDPTIYPILKRKGIYLSDTGEDTPEIGLLIGADYLGAFLTGTIETIDNNLVAVKTKLGWTLQGIQKSASKSLESITYTTNLDLTELWSLDAIGVRDPIEVKSRQVTDEETVDFFHKTVKRNEDDRYEVCLPWKSGRPELGSNRELAVKRLMSTTKNLMRSGHLSEYHNVFNEWYLDGVIEVVDNVGNNGHYLSHHPVIKTGDTTTKIRPVFDASAKDSKGNSLNNCLERGPNLLELVPKLIMQFRKNAIGITSDIKKAFLQISLNPEDRDYFRFLWWRDFSRQDEIITFRHCRVVFGASPSPFLLEATIAHHLENVSDERKKTAHHLRNSFYVDNCITSLETKEEAAKFISEAKELMSAAKFELRGWITSAEIVEEEHKRFVSVLGLSWDTERDELFCNSNVEIPEERITKRVVLSAAQRLFDPIGLTCPVSLVPKVLLQKIWKMKISWDEVLPPDISNKFLAWSKQLPSLKDCKIPRRLVSGPFENCQLSLHCFSDASEVAYSACIFLRSVFDEKISVKLVASKSRVAPTKEITIPRLELLGALILSRLYRQVSEGLELKINRVYFWTDSTVALTWIKRESSWNVFVANRVTEIRKNTNYHDWHFVPGHMNPADLPSRGCDAKFLLKSKWWEGSEWLKMSQDFWPLNEEQVIDENLVKSEMRKTIVSNVECNSVKITDNLLYFSKYTKILRMFTWILRFVKNCRLKEKFKKTELTYEEVHLAENRLLKLIQKESFSGTQEKFLKNWQTFKDENDMIRLRTRLLLGDEKENFKCPVLLHSNHEIIRRLVQQKHCELQHAGFRTLIANLRENYWIISINKLARQVISSCTVCKRFKAKPTQPLLAPLPKDRIKVAAVFEVSGIDLAGPLYLRSGEKTWIVLFTCAIYRAVHFELVNSLSTEVFIMALRRFFARRGRVNIIYTDNGTNFTGSSNAMKNLDWDRIMAFSTIKRIKWNFNPPTAAWWGGFWERMIRMLKEMLRRILGRKCVDYEELETILCDCEATINSRPLTYIEDNSDGLKPLTPACFLQGLPSNDTADLDEIDSKCLNKRLRFVQKLRHDLRKRFRTEYLAMLVHKCHSREETLNVGDVVLLETEGKRINWPLGIIMELLPGADGHSRVAKVRTADGEKLRPFQRLYSLEISSSEKSSFLTQPTYQSTLHPATPDEGDPDSNKDSEPSLEVIPEVTTRTGRRIKIPNRLDL